ACTSPSALATGATSTPMTSTSNAIRRNTGAIDGRGGAAWAQRIRAAVVAQSHAGVVNDLDCGGHRGRASEGAVPSPLAGYAVNPSMAFDGGVHAANGPAIGEDTAPDSWLVVC
ncbi:hypothetical protein BRM31_20700, partial [Xanthomonas oryzae pv. oryzae]